MDFHVLPCIPGYADLECFTEENALNSSGAFDYPRLSEIIKLRIVHFVY